MNDAGTRRGWFNIATNALDWEDPTVPGLPFKPEPLMDNTPTNQGSDNPWPLMGYSPGLYFCKCRVCGQQFNGEKHSYQCLTCAAKKATVMLDSMATTIKEKQALIERMSIEHNEQLQALAVATRLVVKELEAVQKSGDPAVSVEPKTV